MSKNLYLRVAILWTFFICAAPSPMAQLRSDLSKTQTPTPITVNNVGKLTELVSFDVHSAPLDLTFGLDTNILASADQDGSIWIWKPESEMTSLTGHTDAVSSVLFTNHDATLISGGLDSTLRLWDLKSQQTQYIFQSNAPIWSMAFAPHEQLLAYGDRHGLIQLLSADLRQGKGTLHTDFSWTVMSLAFSPDEKILAAAYANGLWLWNIESRHVLNILSEHATNKVTFNPSGSTLVSEDGQVHIWDLQSRSEVAPQPEQGPNIPSALDLAVSPDGQIIASGSYDNFVQLWDSKTGHLLTTLQGNIDVVSVVAFSSDGTLLASGDLTGKIIIWSILSHN